MRQNLKVSETFRFFALRTYNPVMPSPLPLEPNCLYHVFNRGINGEYLFREERNYEHFLRLYALHIEPIAQTFANCLLRNHFHIAIRVKEVVAERVDCSRIHIAAF